MNRKYFLEKSGISIFALLMGGITNKLHPSVFSSEHFITATFIDNQEYDVVVIGGSYAGLSVSMSLARCLRKVLVIDAGKPRNAMVSKANNLFGNDGVKPSIMQNSVKDQLKRYKQYLNYYNGTVSKAEGSDLGFTVTINNGQKVTCKKIVFATGCTDPLPAIEGFKEQWGKNIHHCPYCHGFESTEGRTLVISEGFEGTILMGSVAHWCKDLTFCTNGFSKLNNSITDFFTKENITLITDSVKQIVSAKNGDIDYVEFSNGNKIQFNHIYFHSNPIYQTVLLTNMGCKIDESKRMETNDFMETNQKGVYAIGDISNKSMEQIIWAANSGLMAAVGINNELIAEKYKG